MFYHSKSATAAPDETFAPFCCLGPGNFVCSSDLSHFCTSLSLSQGLHGGLYFPPLTGGSRFCMVDCTSPHWLVEVGFALLRIDLCFPELRKGARTWSSQGLEDEEIRATAPQIFVGWKWLVPLNPMVLLIIIPMKNGYFIGNINPTFSDKAIFLLDEHINLPPRFFKRMPVFGFRQPLPDLEGSISFR